MILLKKEQFYMLQPVVLADGQIAEGSEGKLFVFDKSIFGDSNPSLPVAIKIFNYWNEFDLKECIAHKKKKLSYLLDLNKSDNVTFPIDLVYIDNVLAGYSMHYIINCHNIRDEIVNNQLDNFYNLSHIVNVIKTLQRAIRYDLHHQDVYAQDIMSLTNIVLKEAIPYIVDVDSFEIGKLVSSNQKKEGMKKDNILEIIAIFGFLITKRYVHISRVERLFEKKRLNSFEKFFLNYLNNFSYHNDFEYLNEDILDELSNCYYMTPSNSSSIYDSKFLLKRR